jgi:hypothetical protein
MTTAKPKTTKPKQSSVKVAKARKCPRCGKLNLWSDEPNFCLACVDEIQGGDDCY